MLCPFFFAIYINKLSNHVVYTVKLLAVDNTFIAHNAKASVDVFHSIIIAYLILVPTLDGKQETRLHGF